MIQNLQRSIVTHLCEGEHICDGYVHNLFYKLTANWSITAKLLKLYSKINCLAL